MTVRTDKSPKVVLTDHPWPDLDIEEEIFGRAGIALIAGPVDAPDAATVERMIVEAEPDAVMTCWAQVTAAAIERPKRLRLVTRLGIGLDNIAVTAATERGAWVTNVPSYCVGEVSDHAIALLLAHCRGVIEFDRSTKAGAWEPSRARLQRVADLTVGIIGFGQIGRETGRKLLSFGCRILAHSRSMSGVESPIVPASLEDIRQQADVIVLHLPLTADTHHLVDLDFLRACNRRPLLINVSRGGLVDNDALLQALDEGLLCGAAVDVLEGEPHPPREILLHPGAIVTPHISFSSTASLRELRREACEEVVRVLSGGRPLNPCNDPVAPGLPLDGGIASDIRIVSGPNGVEVVKRALPKLRVKADWYADPSRSLTEVAALETAAELLGPEQVPAVLWSDPDRYSFAMSLIEPAFHNWKQSLLDGLIEPGTAAEAGRQLGRLHRLSALRPDIQARFADTSNFEELRVDPFFVRTAEHCAALAAPILDAAKGMAERRSALVHGDYSPKNLLTNGRDIVILDWEVAHWGDPRFDIAFCLSHLLLKAFRREADRSAMLGLAASFAESYREENTHVWDDDLGPLVGALLMARLHGSSPVDYLESVDVRTVRKQAELLLSASAAPDLAGIGI